MNLFKMKKYNLYLPEPLKFQAKNDNAWNFARAMDKYILADLKEEFKMDFSIYSRQYGFIGYKGVLESLNIQVYPTKGIYSHFMITLEMSSPQQYNYKYGNIKKSKSGKYNFHLNYNGIYYTCPIVNHFYKKVAKCIYNSIINLQHKFIININDY